MPKILYLGSKFINHDSSVFAIFIEEKKIFGIETERLSRYKHDDLYPIMPIEKLIDYFSINKNEIGQVYFAHSSESQRECGVVRNEYNLKLSHRQYFNSKYKNEFTDNYDNYRKKNYLYKIINLFFSRSGRYIFKYVILKKLGIESKENLSRTIKRQVGNIFKNVNCNFFYFDHHLCHALSSYYTSDFDEALSITSDAWGDEKFSTVYIMKDDKVQLFSVSGQEKIRMYIQGSDRIVGLSVGIIFSYFTELLGYFSDSDEGKVEALAAFGNWDNEIYNELYKCTKINKEKKSIEFEKSKLEKFLDYQNVQSVIKKYRKEDIAAAVQKYLEEIHLEYLKFIVKETGINNICFSGGVAANVILNLRIYEEVTKNLHITPAMSDDGTAQGAAINLLLENGYSYEELKWLKNIAMPYYSSSYSKDEIIKYLKKNNFNKYYDLGETWPEEVAERIVAGEIGAIFHGRMEWGPRALGNRSILADPRRKNIKKIINLNIKNRPEFQPFCPSILAEEKERLFADAYLNKHMTCAFRMRDEHAEKLPGAVHVDNTCRVQFVEEKDNPNYYRILKKIKELTGYGVVINTSFNKHGRTIVESPHDALTDFFDTNLDFLVMEGILIKKND